MQPLIQSVESFSAGIRIVLGCKEGKVIEIVVGKSAMKGDGAAIGEIHMLIHPAVFDTRLAVSQDAQKGKWISAAPADKFALEDCFAVEVDAGYIGS